MNNKLLCLDINTSCLINYKKLGQNKTQGIIVTKIFMVMADVCLFRIIHIKIGNNL